MHADEASVSPVAITWPSNHWHLGQGRPVLLTSSSISPSVPGESVKYYANNVLIGISTDTNTFSLSWTPAVSGTYTLTAVALDPAGTLANSSAPVFVQVTNPDVPVIKGSLTQTAIKGLVPTNLHSTEDRSASPTSSNSGSHRAQNPHLSPVEQAADAPLKFQQTTPSYAGDGTFDAPSNLVGHNLTPREIDLTWINHATRATSIIIDISTDQIHWTRVVRLEDPKATFYAVTSGIEPGVGYYFRAAGDCAEDFPILPAPARPAGDAGGK